MSVLRRGRDGAIFAKGGKSRNTPRATRNSRVCNVGRAQSDTIKNVAMRC